MVEESEKAQAQLMLDIANKKEEYEDARYSEWLATSEPPTTKPKPTETKPKETKPKETTKPTEETKKPTEETKPKETTKPTEEDKKPAESEKVTWKVPIKYKKFTSPYGWRTDPVYGGKRFHYGVDLAADEGTKIVASRGGTVTTATYEKNCGYYVQIDHGDGYKSIYMHMTHYVVKKGAKVTQGQTIGYCGSTGKSTGPHLHFGISYNGSYVNPAKYIPI
jgi:murein DD-endopeptidase MepM/ murein hydrolase activator NlpD